MKYYLGREGVAFGPYTEFQVRESVRIGIFQETDLALAETGTEWSAVAELLPVAVVQPTAQTAKITQEVPVTPEVGEKTAAQARLPTGRRWPTREWKFAFAGGAIAATVCALAVWAVERRPVATAPVPPRAVSVIPPATSDPIAMPTGSKITVAELLLAPPLVDPVADLDEPDPTVQPAPDSGTDTAAHRSIEGQIFIDARNGVKYEPSFVEVRLYPLAQLKPYLEKRAQEASAKFDELKTRIATAEAEKEIFRKAADKAFDAYVQAKPENRRALEQAVAESKKAREKATNDYYSLLQNREDLLSGSFYLEDLPPPAGVTRTDEQGRFAFDVPADGQFAVVAGAQRGTDDAIERYYWFVPVSIDGEPRTTVLLSNTNVSSHGSTDSLVQTAD